MSAAIRLTAMLCVLGIGTAAAQERQLSLVPLPVSVEAGDGAFRLSPSTRILLDGASRALGEYAVELVAAETGHELRAEPRERQGSTRGSIVLTLSPADTVMGAEGYRLRVDSSGVRLSARREAGLFYGLQTLRQLLAADSVSLRGLTIADQPRFRYRGMHLDVARHRFPVEFIKRYIDLMSRYKLNTFHWHLTDDQGWRIEIRGYPRLTTVGAWRKETIVGQNFDPYKGDGMRYGGFYTQAEVREIVRYAAARHITVIPEIEMPGHAQAALAAYPSLACTPGPFEVSTMWGVDEDIFCPSERTFQFLQGVLTEVLALFPSRYIHIGGDEAPKARWKKSSIAQAVMRRHGLKDEQQLQSWFVQRIERFLRARGRRLIGWDEILEGGLAPQATVMSWRGTDGGIAAAKQGHDVIMTPGSHLYFDHAQGDPALEPLSIGGNTPLARVYEFEPVPPALTAAEARHVLGAQANLWTEYIKTPEQAEYMLFPRLLALAEVVWSPKEARDWTAFATRLPGQLGALDRLGVNYRIPHVEGLETNRLTLSDTATVELRSLLPESSEVRYTLDGTSPTQASTLYAGPLRIAVAGGPVTVTAAVFTPDGRSSPIRRASFTRTSLRPAERIDEQRLRRGLQVAYYESRFDSAKAMSRGAPTSVGVSDSIGFAGNERPETFGLRFTGFLRVPASGLYMFSLVSDDGSVLRVGGQVVVDNDGWHSETERSGMIALEAGLHPINVDFVQGSGGKSLKAFIQREGGSRARLAGEMLAHTLSP